MTGASDGGTAGGSGAGAFVVRGDDLSRRRVYDGDVVKLVGGEPRAGDLVVAQKQQKRTRWLGVLRYVEEESGRWAELWSDGATGKRCLACFRPERVLGRVVKEAFIAPGRSCDPEIDRLPLAVRCGRSGVPDAVLLDPNARPSDDGRCATRVRCRDRDAGTTSAA